MTAERRPPYLSCARPGFLLQPPATFFPGAVAKAFRGVRESGSSHPIEDRIGHPSRTRRLVSVKGSARRLRQQVPDGGESDAHGAVRDENHPVNRTEMTRRAIVDGVACLEDVFPKSPESLETAAAVAGRNAKDKGRDRVELWRQV